MKDNSKKLSGIALVLYIIAAVFAAIAIFMLIYTINYLKTYTESYGMSISDLGLDALQYFITAVVPYIAYAVITFGIAKLLPKKTVQVVYTPAAPVEEVKEEPVEELQEEPAEEIIEEAVIEEEETAEPAAEE